MITNPEAALSGSEVEAEIVARSVVAAACRTAVSVGAAPDELLGLGYGLIAAGAAEVICSLWDIDYSVTALLVARLYIAG